MRIELRRRHVARYMEEVPIFFFELAGDAEKGDASPGMPTGFEVDCEFESSTPRKPDPSAGGDASGCRYMEDMPIFFFEPVGEAKEGDESPGMPKGFGVDRELDSSGSMMPRKPDPRAGGETSGKRKYSMAVSMGITSTCEVELTLKP